MFYAIWYHLRNLKIMKNTHGGVLLLKACNFAISNTPPWLFLRFLICTNGTKLRNALFQDIEMKVYSILILADKSVINNSVN